MKITGIAAEYNPFHSGHEYQINHLRETGTDAVVAVMSGNFVQRGECALYDRFSRAAVAVECGVDLVVGLPVSFSIASAEKFAYGCVYLLNALGCVDKMCFGSECGDGNMLRSAADECAKMSKSDIREEITGGRSFASARAAVLKKRGVYVPETPNDILAVEYIKALSKISSHIDFETIKRVGDFHQVGAKDGFAGAEFIRKVARSEPGADISPYVPSASVNMYKKLFSEGRAPSDMKYLERAVIAFLRTVTPSSLSDIQGMTEGLENRICEAAFHSVSLDDLYMKAKSKRYALSAIRRAVLSAFLGIKKSDAKIPYVQVLAFGKKGSEILKTMKKTCDLPVIHTLSPECERDVSFSPFAKYERHATDIFFLATPSVGEGYKEFVRKAGLLK